MYTRCVESANMLSILEADLESRLLAFPYHIFVNEAYSCTEYLLTHVLVRRLGLAYAKDLYKSFK